MLTTLVGVQSHTAHAATHQAPLVLAPTQMLPQAAPQSPQDLSYPGCGSMDVCIAAASAGDVISITAGTYTDSFTLDKAVSLVGLDAGATFMALSSQRVITVNDVGITNSTVISNLTFTGGNIPSDVGGGVYVDSGEPHFYNVVITGNIASDGGGLASDTGLHATSLTVQNNQAVGFVGLGEGGGLFVNGMAVISDGLFLNNTATGNGGGMFLTLGNDSVIRVSRFQYNKAEGEGGGLYIDQSRPVLLVADRFFDNQGVVSGGGAYFESSDVNMDNNMFGFNYGTVITNGVELALGAGPTNSNVHGRHNTFANKNSSTSSLRAIELGKDISDTLFLTNTVFDKYNVGIKVLTYTSDVRINGVMWSGVNVPFSGGEITNTNSITTLASFESVANRDFRISSTSSTAGNMVDKGVNSGLAFDFEDYPRPHGFGYDLGADEINRKPVAAYDAAFYVEVGHLATISPDPGSVYDPDGDPITYTWQQVGGTPVTLSDYSALTVTFIAPITPTTVSTEPQFKITITDTSNGGTSIQKPARVKVLAPVVGLSAANNSPKLVNQAVTLTPTISSGTSVTYTWNYGDGSLVKNIGLSGNPVVTHSYAATGTYIAIVTATNAISSLTTTTTVTIQDSLVTPTPSPTPTEVPTEFPVYLPILTNQ